MRISHLLFALFFVLVSHNTHSQTEQKSFYSHIRFGGGIGLSFGSGYFSGFISPSAIYQFDSPFALGVGLTAAYTSVKYNHTATIWGGSVIGLYAVIPELQLSAEFEELNVRRNYEYDGANLTEDFWYPALFLGVGYHNNNVTIGLKYDVLYKPEKSIYSQPYIPFVRIYF